MEFSKEEQAIILDLCKKKLKGIDWVLKEKSEELKADKKSDLEDKKNKLQSLIDKIGTE
ncbi:MAG: hypothetical protein OXC37_00835 [Bdellovibrionaceae bacterium]|nr:hypothetical protein [Pseudobdellovibrionaceae bacterium]